MKSSLAFILLGLAVVAAFWCCLALAGLGLVTYSGSIESTREANWLQTAVPEPDAEIERRAPTAAERETEALIARSEVPERDLTELAHRLRGVPLPTEPTPVPTPVTYELGDTSKFWLHNVETNSYYTTTAVLRAETAHAYWWVETGYDVPADDLEQSALNFEEQTYPTTRSLFGSEWRPGIDGDEHVYIFLGNVPGVGGYFSAPDAYPVTIHPQSNEHEMFYINLENAAPGNDYFDGILAHEFQHMIHWAHDRNEDSWINEGLSELAGQLNGYDVGSSDYEFSQAPDTQLTTWSELRDAAPHYGASYVFMSYLHDRYGEEFIRQLTAEPANGIAGINAVLERLDPGGPRFADLYGDWLVANYLDEPDLLDGRFGHASLAVEGPRLAAEHSRYPVYEKAAVRNYGADYILLEGQDGVTLEFTGSTLVPLVDNRSHSGEYQWWSNRGDEGDSRLTRAFDLTGLHSATLQAWLWYDLEPDYDYAYVEVSADGGETWTILANEHTVTTNPSGNSYGPALTGSSGGGVAEWVQHSFDLTPFAGQEVLVRFEVITDEALNYPGLAIDDVTIAELGYRYDVETEDRSWQAEGFVRVADRLPQQFLVQVILEGEETRVERVALDELSQGRFAIAGLGTDVDRAIVIVTALAPVTTEWAAYEYRISPVQSNGQ